MSYGTYGSSATGSTRASGGVGDAFEQESGSPMQSLQQHLVEFCRENPATAAAWCFGIGFVLGWRLKPW